jgi:tetratricopeptide (TPR) repeat protein
MESSTAMQATVLNEDGIALFAAREYEQAIKRFSRGLNMLKQVLAEHEGDDDEDDQIYEKESSSLSCDFLIQHEEESSISKVDFIFRSPMVIDSNFDESAAKTFKYYIHLSFVLLYNLALAHHLSAHLADQEHRDRFFQRAKSLYELAYTIQMTEGIHVSVIENLALVNNLAQVHRDLGCDDLSRQCLEQLLSTLVFANDFNVDVHQLDGFIGNIVPLILKENKYAAAA